MNTTFDNWWYQLGGYRSHTNGFNHTPDLQRYFIHNLFRTLYPPPITSEDGSKCIPPPPACLTNQQGIREGGTSHLLITQTQCQALFRELKLEKDFPRHPPPHPSSRYLSLSPIVFTSSEHLKEKIKSFQQRANKRGKANYNYDTSPANSLFDAEKVDERRRVAGDRRSAFEHSRLLWKKLYTKDDLSLYFPSWDGDISGISTLAFTTWSYDKQIATILDIGWSDVKLEKDATTGDVKDVYETTHIRVAENMTLAPKESIWMGKSSQSMPEGKAASEKLLEEQAAKRLCARFESILAQHSQDPARPHILIVYDTPLVVSCLGKFGVSTSGWGLGLKALFEYAGDERSWKGSSSPRSGYRPKDERNRSPPPRRPSNYYDRDTPGNPGSSVRHDRYPRPKREDDRYRSSILETEAPQRKRRCAPIHVIDVRELYGTVSLRELCGPSILSGISLRETCIKLGVTEDLEGWCAGLDAEYLYEAWQSLSGGPPIDERRKELEALKLNITPLPSTSASMGIQGSSTAPDLFTPVRRPKPTAYDDYDEGDDQLF
ncbi:hypothetical protein FRB99_007069 [Tulasnella sp. 403]|nr:hypothetical protein FRB99_007069 [Tulasnella sp. 403]